jgi:hypothetical protein
VVLLQKIFIFVRKHFVMPNRISRAIAKTQTLPFFLKNWARDFSIGYMVPMVGKAGVHFVETNTHTWQATLKNSRKVGNHLKQIHAAAMILLAETVAVMITAYNLPDDKIPLVKHIDAAFVKRSFGDMHAIVSVTDAQIALMQDNPKGELVLDVTVTDAAGNQPIIVKVTSAWVPKPSTVKT